MINRVCEVPSGNVSAWQGKGFSNHENLHQIVNWPPIGNQGSQRAQHLVQLIKRMMAHDDEARPRISEVVKELAVDFQDGHSFFGACCS